MYCVNHATPVPVLKPGLDIGCADRAVSVPVLEPGLEMPVLQLSGPGCFGARLFWGRGFKCIATTVRARCFGACMRSRSQLF